MQPQQPPTDTQQRRRQQQRRRRRKRQAALWTLCLRSLSVAPAQLQPYLSQADKNALALVLETLGSQLGSANQSKAVDCFTASSRQFSWPPKAELEVLSRKQAEDFVREGLTIVDDFMPEELVAGLAQHCATDAEISWRFARA